MGTIARQTFKGSLYSYLGAGLGFVNVVILMPHIFSVEQIGLTNILISIAAIFGQLGCLGFNSITTRLFPYFRNNDKSHNGFLFLAIITGLVGFAICVLIFFLIKPYLINTNIEESPLFVKYIFLLIPLIFISIFFLIFDTYNRLLFNASFGIFVKEFLLRILNLAGILIFFKGYIGFTGFIYYYSAVYAVPLLLIFFLLLYQKQISFKPAISFLKNGMKIEMFKVAMFGLVSGFSGIAAMHIDRYMVNHFLDLGYTGVYATAFYFGTMILLPGRSLFRIASTSIAEAFKDNKLEIISSIYKKSSRNQLLIAALLFILIWANIDNIFEFLPEEFHKGKYVVFYISLAYLFLMGGGVSSEIIQFSKHFRFYSAFMLMLIVKIVVFNILFIPIYGIEGAALASFISYAIYTFIKFLFLYVKFGFQPFTPKHLVIIILSIFAYYLTYFIPDFDNNIVDIIKNSIVIGVLFCIPAYFLKLSEELNSIINKAIKDKTLF